MGNNTSVQLPDEQFNISQATLYHSVEELSTFHDHAVITSPTGACRSRPDMRQSLREELLQERSPLQNRHNPGEMPLPLRTLYSGQQETWKAPAGSTVTVEAAVAILQELRKNATQEDLVTLQRALLPSTESDRSDGLVRYRPEAVGPAAAALIRRKSLFQPGIATRPKSSTLLRKSPTGKSKKQKSETWSPEMFVTSPLDRLATLDGNGKPIPVKIERAATPSDIGHSYLGTLALGSLRVTNGAASPEPSIYSGMQSHHAPVISPRQAEDYFTASEGSRSHSGGDDDLASLARSPSIQESESSYYTTSNYSVQPASSGRPTMANLMGHNRQQEARQPRIRVTLPSQSHAAPVELVSQPFSASGTERSVSPRRMYLTEAQSNPFLPPAEEQSSMTERNTKIHSRASPCSPQVLSESPKTLAWPIVDGESIIGRTSTPGRLYMQESQSNPFLLDEGHDFPSFHTNDLSSSHVSEMEENIPEIRAAESCYSQSHYSAPSRESSRKDALRRLDGSYDQELMASSFSGLLPQSHPVSKKSVVSDLAKKRRPAADSGYGSDSSLRTLMGNGSSETVEILASSRSKQPAAILIPETASAIMIKNVKVPTQDDQAATCIPDHSLSPFTHCESSKINKESSAQDTNPATAQLSRHPRLDLTPVRTSPAQISQEQSSAGEEAMTPTKKSKKLTKKCRPQSERWNSAPLAVQGLSADLNEVPGIPAAVATKHVARLNKHPGMEYLERTFKDVSQSSPNSRDVTLTPEPSKHPSTMFVSFPEPEETQSADRGRWKRKSLDSKKPSTRLWRSKSRKRLEEEEQDREDYGIVRGATDYDGIVADLGTVASSLGTSPYEIAFTAENHRKNRRKSSNEILHPHQLSFGARRTISTGMTEEEAAKLAKEKSRDRLANFKTDDAVRTEHKRPHQIPHDSMEDLSATGRRGQADEEILEPPRPSFAQSAGENKSRRITHLSSPSMDSVCVELGYGFSASDEEQSQPIVEYLVSSPQTLDEDVFDDLEDETVIVRRQPREDQRDEDGKTIVKRVQERRVTATGNPEWEGISNIWRARRKSIGENLLHKHDQTDGTEDEKENHTDINQKSKTNHEASLGPRRKSFGGGILRSQYQAQGCPDPRQIFAQARSQTEVEPRARVVEEGRRSPLGPRQAPSAQPTTRARYYASSSRSASDESQTIVIPELRLGMDSEQTKSKPAYSHMKQSGEPVNMPLVAPTNTYSSQRPTNAPQQQHHVPIVKLNSAYTVNSPVSQTSTVSRPFNLHHKPDFSLNKALPRPTSPPRHHRQQASTVPSVPESTTQNQLPIPSKPQNQSSSLPQVKLPQKSATLPNITLLAPSILMPPSRDPPATPRSPSPSIRERAARFERPQWNAQTGLSSPTQAAAAGWRAAGDAGLEQKPIFPPEQTVKARMGLAGKVALGFGKR